MSFPRHPTTPFPTANRRSYELRRTPSLRTLLSTARTHLLLTPFDPALLLAVLPHLPRSDKATLLRLNTAFYWLVSPVLHTHLILPRAPWPRLRPLVPAPREYEDWLTAHPPEAWVHTLDVHAHPSRRCMRAHAHETDTEYAPPTHNCPERIPFLPRIRTLRVHAPLHTDTGQRDIVPQCAALQNVRAPKLVLVGAPCSSPLTSLPYATLAAVDHYVLLLAPDDNVDPLAPVLLASAIASDIAHTTACSATLVLVPPVPWMEFRTPGGDSDVHQSWAGRMLAELAAHLAHLPLTVRIVNAGAVDHRTLGTDAWDPVRGQALLETHFRNALRAEGRSCCTVEFVDMPTYLLDAPADELGERLEEWRTSAGTGVGVGGGAGAPEVVGVVGDGVAIPRGEVGTPPSRLTPKRPPASLSRSPRTPRRAAPAPLMPASRIVSLRTQSGPGSPIASMAQAVARRASDKIAQRRASEKRVSRRVVTEADENARW